MLDKFLETNIQSKLQILYAFQTHGDISVKDLSQLLGISPGSINDLLTELNITLDCLAFIRKDSSALSLNLCAGVDFFELLLAVYQQSDTLQCLKFLILNDAKDSFTAFVDESFLTKSSAYRIRKNCIAYLRLVGLDVSQNKVVGDEYRIRFLIALLHYKYGVDFDYFDLSTKLLARNFILSTNDVIDMDFLEYTENEYGYFECLLILSWKRKNYTLEFPQEGSLEKLKAMFIYDEMKKAVKKTLEPLSKVTFTENDYTYLLLAFSSTNNCFFSDKWTPEDIELVRDIVFSQDTFNHLLQRFAERFGEPLLDSHPLKSVIIYFYKKCLLELQCLIPDKHFYLNSLNSPLTRLALQETKEILDAWHKDTGRRYPLDDNHVLYLAFQIDVILRQHAKPVQLVIVSDMVSQIKVMTLHFSQEFSSKRVKIIPFLLNAQNPDILRKMSNSVIVVNHKFKNVMNDLYVNADLQSSVIIPVNTELTAYDMDSVYHAINMQEEKNHLMLFSPHTS